jgi:signal transduction histidine kinase/ActR/RegA family two-component response regulator
MKLRTKFLFSLIAVTAVLSIASLLLVRHRVRQHVREELTQSLDNSVSTFQEAQHQRDDASEITAAFVANVPSLKAVMTTHDPATIQDTTGDIRRMAGADVLAIADPSGRLMAVHATGMKTPQPVVAVLFARAFEPARRRDWWYLEGRLFEVFFQPIYVGSPAEHNLLGVLAMGYAIDSQMAQQAGRIAGGQAAFRYGDRIVISTLSPAAQRQLQTAAAGDALGAARELKLNGETFVTALAPLADNAGTPVQLVMLRSYDQATSFLNSLNELIVLVAVSAILVGAIFVFLISHTFTRPLDDLVKGARAAGKGDFSYPLTVRGNDEVAELTEAFDKMRRSIQDGQARIVNAARMEAVGKLAGGVAHDFNNLITIIKGYTELLLGQTKSDSPIVSYAEQIKRAADRAASVTRQLLAFSRKQVAQRQPLDLNAVAVTMSKMFRVLIGEDIEVKIVGESGLRKVFADVGQVEQVLLNLAVNARDAMPRGGKLTVETTNLELNDAAAQAIPGAKPGRYVKLSVTDTGCGMSEETRSRIFELFFTTKEPGKGTGLGLAIVQGLVQQEGGFVQVESELGRGSTISVCLPESQQVAEIAGFATKRAAPAQRGGTILVVEDEVALRALVRESLRLNGYQVLEAADGEEGLAVLRQHSDAIDLVITDVVMPRMGGLDLVAKLQGLRPNTLVLLMSGYTDRASEVESSGMPLLQKPFVPDQLLEAVADVLKRRKSMGQSAASVS